MIDEDGIRRRWEAIGSKVDERAESVFAAAEGCTAGRGGRRGGGGKRVAINDPGLVPALKRLVEPATRGDPVRPLIWVSKSMDKLDAALTDMGHPITARTR